MARRSSASDRCATPRRSSAATAASASLERRGEGIETSWKASHRMLTAITDDGPRGGAAMKPIVAPAGWRVEGDAGPHRAAADEPLITADEEGRRPSALLIATGIALLVVIAFFPAIRCGFVS